MNYFNKTEFSSFSMGLPICVTLKLQFYENFVVYFDLSKELTLLKESAESFAIQLRKRGTNVSKRLLAPFNWVYCLDLLLLHEKFELLYDIVVAEPLIAEEILREITWGVLVQFEELRFIQVSDVQVQIIFSTLPLLSIGDCGIVTWEGILMAKTLPRKFIRSGLWFCEDESCSGYSGVRQSSLSSCLECGGAVEEDVSGRDVGEFVLARIISPQAVKGGIGVFSSKIIRIKDELLRSSILQLGMVYKMAGVVYGAILDVWSLQIVCNPTEALMRSPIGHIIPLPSVLATLYRELSHDLPGSPWAFAAAVVSSLSSDLFPVSSLLHLKFGLMLSLASQKRDCYPVPVIAVGTDTRCANQLMQSVSKLAERVVHASYAPLGGALTKDHDGYIWEEAGDLTAATNGVCILGDWSMYRMFRGMGNAIDCLEVGQVVMENHTDLDLPKKELPLRAAVWSYWGHVTARKRDQQQLKTLIDVFGMPFLVDEKDLVQQELISREIVNRATVGNNIEPVAVPEEELRQYLNIVTSINVEMSQSASDLVKSFFVTCRKERGELLPLSAIQTISSLAEAHARLSLRHIVIAEDVALIIYLYQEAVITLFGSILGSDFPQLTWDENEPTYSHVHQQMMSFLDWLERYTGTSPQ